MLKEEICIFLFSFYYVTYLEFERSDADLYIYLLLFVMMMMIFHVLFLLLLLSMLISFSFIFFFNFLQNFFLISLYIRDMLCYSSRAILSFFNVGISDPKYCFVSWFMFRYFFLYPSLCLRSFTVFSSCSASIFFKKERKKIYIKNDKNIFLPFSSKIKEKKIRKYLRFVLIFISI